VTKSIGDPPEGQGSEYPAVVIPVLTQHYAMLQRNLLYTGVTRGKRLVVLVGQKKAVAIAVRNVSGRRRWSKLNEWLAAPAGSRCRSMRCALQGIAGVPTPSVSSTVSGSPPLAAPRLSIVVLPFTNLSDDREQQYFADGITEDLTTDLSLGSRICS
jgi:hypothetical protein